MEIFSAIQGEGPWLGIRQVFVRLFRCNLRCAWCDTPESFELTGPGILEIPPGSRQFAKFENPVSAFEIFKWLMPFLGEPHHSISFTGGEPLLQKDFLKELLPFLKESNEKIFLETGGSLPEILEELIDFVDYVSMDLKLPSSAGERPLWKKHEAFLRLAAAKETVVKIVLTRDTLEKDIVQALDLVKRVAPRIPVILQPVTPFNGCQPPDEMQMLHWQTLALKMLPDVRVIPQTHKLIGQK